MKALDRDSRVRRELKRATSRFRNISLAGLASTLWRAASLHLGHFRPSPTDRASRTEHVVVSLTTIPGRAHRLRPALLSILDQSEPADRIVLALPGHTRSGESYPEPAGLNLPAGVDIVRCDDDGPATKLLPALRLWPDSVVVAVDDDVVYPRGFLETLLKEHRNRPDAALGYRGVRLDGGMPFLALDHVFASAVVATTPVDVLFGTWGYLVPPGSLDAAVHDFTEAPAQVRWVDDVWISGHLARAKIPRFVVRSRDLPIETATSFKLALTAGINRTGENDEIALKHFADDW